MKSEKGFIEIEDVLMGICILIVAFLVLRLIVVVYNEVSFGEKEGIIIDKYYREAHTSHSMMYIGKSMIPKTTHHKESWNFKIEKEIDGEKRSITVKVNEDTYNQYNIGDYFKKEEQL